MTKWMIIKPGRCQKVNMELIAEFMGPETKNPDKYTWMWDFVTEAEAGGTQFRSYIFQMDEALSFWEDILNISIILKKFEGEHGGFQEWYPEGGVWMALGNSETDGYAENYNGDARWLWIATDSTFALPYSTLPDFVYEDGIKRCQGLVQPEGTSSGYHKSNYTNLFWWFQAQIWGEPVPEDFTVEYLHIVIRTNSTFFWDDNGLGATLQDVRACKNQFNHFCEEY